MGTYLSIDLDYWANKFEKQFTLSRKQPEHFLAKVKSLNVPIFITDFHDGLVPDVNKYKVDRLINVDYHSDIVYEDEIGSLDAEPLNEGTWVNFYDYRKDCVFEWRYPSVHECFNKGHGRCEWDWNNLEYPDDFDKTRMGYKKVFRKQGLNGIIMSDIVAVGISRSPNWCDEWIYDLIKELK